MLSPQNQKICELFAQLLEYPEHTLTEAASECDRNLADSFPAIAGEMKSFVAFTQGQRREALEELYIQTFDMTPVTTLYFGYQLFGDNPKRSAFLVSLEEAYQKHNFSHGGELADHLCVLLRFLSTADDAEFTAPLLEECILPVLERIENTLKKDKNAYRPVLGSLRAFLQPVSRKLVRAGGPLV